MTFEDVQKLLQTRPYGRCPHGHALPRYTTRGQCTPDHCADYDMVTGRIMPQDRHRTRGQMIARVIPTGADKKGFVSTAERNASLMKAPKDNAEAVEQEATAAELAKVLASLARKAVRYGFVPEPPKVEDGKEEEYAEREIARMLPEAVHELRCRLKFGDDKERYEAALEVMGMKGFSKSDKKMPTSGPVIVVTGAMAAAPPWAQPIDVTPKPKELNK